MKRKNIIGIITFFVLVFFIVIMSFNKVKLYYIPDNEIKYYTGQKSESDINTIWCGTFQIAWNELIDYVGNDIKFENNDNEFINKLNKRNFTKDMLSKDDYYVKIGKTTSSLKDEIIKDVKNKFGKNKNIFLNQFDFSNSNGITIYSILNKKFEFLEKFDTYSSVIYGDTSKNVRCFGIKDESNKELYKNVEIIYYENTWEHYGIKLKTKNDEEVILYKTSLQGSFEEIYDEMLNYEKIYNDSKIFRENDYLIVPCVNLNCEINYKELCNQIIENTNGMYIDAAIQTVQFEMNEKGGFLSSQAIIKNDYISGIQDKSRRFNFCQPSCYLFLKEKDKNKPYFALKLNIEFLDVVE